MRGATHAYRGWCSPSSPIWFHHAAKLASLLLLCNSPCYVLRRTSFCGGSFASPSWAGLSKPSRQRGSVVKGEWFRVRTPVHMCICVCVCGVCESLSIVYIVIMYYVYVCKRYESNSAGTARLQLLVSRGLQNWPGRRTRMIVNFSLTGSDNKSSSSSSS